MTRPKNKTKEKKTINVDEAVNFFSQIRISNNSSSNNSNNITIIGPGINSITSNNGATKTKNENNNVSSSSPSSFSSSTSPERTDTVIDIDAESDYYTSSSIPYEKLDDFGIISQENDPNSPRIVSVCSLAPTALQEDFEDHAQNKIPVLQPQEREDEDMEIDDVGVEYRDNPLFYTNNYNGFNGSHFLAGGSDSFVSLDNSVHAIQQNWAEGLNVCEIPTCSNPASKKCSSCKKAFYCSSEHQKSDWKEHKKSCIPYKLTFVSEDSKSRISAMVASRNIPPGSDIFSERPVLVFPVVSSSPFETNVDCDGLLSHEFCSRVPENPTCFGCMKPYNYSSHHICKNCSLPLCSSSCEYQAPHQIGECRAISDMKLRNALNDYDYRTSCLHALYMDVEILRALLLQTYHQYEWDSFIELKNNIRVEIYKQSKRYIRFKQHVERRCVAEMSLKFSDYNFDLIGDVHAIISSCSFKSAHYLHFKTIYATQLHFLHNCIPNTVHYVENEMSGDYIRMKIVTKASVPIAKGEFIQIDFTTSPYLPYTERRRVLKDLCIECNCNRCLQPSRIGDHTSDLRCMCGKGYVSPEDALKWESSVWSCSTCQEEFPFAWVQNILNKLTKEFSELPHAYSEINVIKDFISRASLQLHPQHSLILAAWCKIESILCKKLEKVREPDAMKIYDSQTLRDFELIYEYTEAVESHMEAIRPGLWVDKGILLFHKFYSHFILQSKEYQGSRLSSREFNRSLIRCLKLLTESLKTLYVFERMGTSCGEIEALGQEGRGVHVRLKELAEQLIKIPSTSTATTTVTSVTTHSSICSLPLTSL